MTDNQPQNRVVITGIGIVSPLGLDTQTTWEGLINGRSGIDHISLFDASNLAVRFGGEVKDFDPANYISRKDIRRMDRFAQLAVAAGKQALENSGLGADESVRQDIGVIVGSGIGGLSVLFEQIKVFLEQGPDRVSPFLVPMMIADMAGAQVSIQLGLKGPNFCTTSACSSGSDAIGTAFEKIRLVRPNYPGGRCRIYYEPGWFCRFFSLKSPIHPQ
jgi:3-oxoacyl-(acyl-carrier-protein) synthase